MKAYEACFDATSTHHIPWYVVPADDKDNARLIVSRIVIDALEALKHVISQDHRETSGEIKIHP